MGKIKTFLTREVTKNDFKIVVKILLSPVYFIWMAGKILWNNIFGRYFGYSLIFVYLMYFLMGMFVGWELHKGVGP